MGVGIKFGVYDYNCKLEGMARVILTHGIGMGLNTLGVESNLHGGNGLGLNFTHTYCATCGAKAVWQWGYVVN